MFFFEFLIHSSVWADRIVASMQVIRSNQEVGGEEEGDAAEPGKLSSLSSLCQISLTPPLERYKWGHKRSLKCCSTQVYPCGNMSLKNRRVPQLTLVHTRPRETTFPSNLVISPSGSLHSPSQLISWGPTISQTVFYPLEIEGWANRQSLCSHGVYILVGWDRQTQIYVII